MQKQNMRLAHRLFLWISPRLNRVRQQLPLLSARRDDLYQLIQHEKKS